MHVSPLLEVGAKMYQCSTKSGNMYKIKINYFLTLKAVVINKLTKIKERYIYKLTFIEVFA